MTDQSSIANSTDIAAAYGPMIVFGGASGIGLATARLAVAAGMPVMIADIDPATAEIDIVQAGKAAWIECDATNQKQVEAAFAAALEAFDTLGAVVTTVGGTQVRDPLEIDIEAWRREQAFNLDSAYLVAAIGARTLKRCGGGAIVTTSSTIAAKPMSDRLAYAAAKAGVIALTKGLALATARDSIRINCVAPHTTDTPRVRSLLGQDVFAERINQSVQGRIAPPEEVAHTILFLCSPASQSTTGQVFWVNNGNYMP